SKERILKKKSEIKILEKTLKEKTEAYDKERERQEKILLYEKELEDIKDDIEAAKKQHEFNHIDDYLQSKEIVLKKLEELNSVGAFYKLNTKVTTSEVKEIISMLSGMPKIKLEINKLENLEEIRANLKNEFVGGNHMIDKIINTYLISESGIFSRNKPVGTFLIGGSGSGKSYISDLISKYLFDGEKSLIRFDMGEFGEKSSVTKLIGAPPGYVGYETGGVLTEALRIKPYSVIVFSNVEKAHKEIQNLIFQIISEGKLKDNKGRNIDLKNTIIFLTTSLDEDKSFGDNISGIEKKVDYIFYLDKLDKESIYKLISIKMKKLTKELIDSQIYLKYDENLLKDITRYVLDNKLEVSDIIKLIEQEIYFTISKKVLELQADESIGLSLEFKDEKFNVRTNENKNWR
ncbi:MAG: AAA family ATPase, partial [Anaerococcus sp.]